MFKGFMRLTVDKWGKLEDVSNTPPSSPIPQSTFEVNTSHNLSAIEYELVTIPEREA